MGAAVTIYANSMRLATIKPVSNPKVPALLAGLKPLATDQYFAAFKPDGSCFWGSPTGYTAKDLPKQVLVRLASKSIKRVVFASFGSQADSWFVVYEDVSKDPEYHMGEGVPSALRDFVDYHRGHASFLRAQLGTGCSFIAWTKGQWACEAIPASLERLLKNISHQDGYTPTKGSFMLAPPNSVAFHENGSYFVSGYHETVRGSYYRRVPYHLWEFASESHRAALTKLFPSGMLASKNHDDLAYATFDPHDKSGEGFVFIRQKKKDEQPEFILRFPTGECFSNLAHAATEVAPKAKPFIVASVKKAGRPHPTDLWELELKLNESVKVFEHRGRGWYFVENSDGEKGFAHETSLDFKVDIVTKAGAEADPCHKITEAYNQFTSDVCNLLVKANIETFPVLSKYIDECRNEECKTWKESGPEVCIHDLTKLLQGSGRFGVQLVKEERNKWHPDKFALFCHPEKRGGLKKTAEELFVLMGLLIDHLEKLSN